MQAENLLIKEEREILTLCHQSKLAARRRTSPQTSSWQELLAICCSQVDILLYTSRDSLRLKNSCNTLTGNQTRRNRHRLFSSGTSNSIVNTLQLSCGFFSVKRPDDTPQLRKRPRHWMTLHHTWNVPTASSVSRSITSLVDSAESSSQEMLQRVTTASRK